MRIDAHQHFWRYVPARDTWITEEMSLLRRDFLPRDLLPELRANEFDATIAVQAAQSEEETSFLLQLAERHPQIAGVVGWVDLTAPDIIGRLAHFRGSEKLLGFRHIVQTELDDRFLLRPDFLRGVSSLAQFRFTYDILIHPRQLPAAIELAAKLVHQRFVLDHIAKPEIKKRKLEPWATHIRQLAAHPNVFCKLSGLITEADSASWQHADFRPFLDVVFEAFSVDRLMFGSDWPVCLLAGTYTQVLQLVAKYAADLPAADRKKIFGANAALFYGLENERIAKAS